MECPHPRDAHSIQACEIETTCVLESLAKYDASAIGARIMTIRGQKVILDADLAPIYGVQTKVLNQAVRRNANKFPADFMFRLTAQEVTDLKSQTVTSSSGGNRSQSVTGSGHGGRRALPSVFTEHGAIMAATVLRSPRAVQMSVFVVRAFVRMREVLGDTRELARKLAALEREVKARLERQHRRAGVAIVQPHAMGFDPLDKRLFAVLLHLRLLRTNMYYGGPCREYRFIPDEAGPVPVFTTWVHTDPPTQGSVVVTAMS